MLTFASSALAQIYIPIFIPQAKERVDGLTFDASSGTMNSTSISSHNLIPWTGNAIDVNEFCGVRRNGDAQAYHIAYYSRPTVATKKIKGIKYQYLENASYISLQESWVNPVALTPAVSKMCNIDFDTWELCSRNAVIDFSSQDKANLKSLYATYKNEYTRRMNEIDASTSNGKDSRKLQEIRDSLKHELATTQYDPEAAVASLKEADGFMISYGVETHIPFTDYVNTGYGLSMTLAYTHGRNIYGLGMDAEFGEKCQKDIVAKKGTIHKGESMLSGSMDVMYGHRAYNGRTTRLTPYVNLGVRFYDGGEVENPKWKGSNYVEKAGLTMGIGMMTDFAVYQSIDIKTSDANAVSKLTNSVRLKPYFSMTHYSGDMGWVPAINVSIEFCNHVTRLR